LEEKTKDQKDRRERGSQEKKKEKTV